MAAAVLATPGTAVADPQAPRQGTPCTTTLDGALTWPAGATSPLRCDAGQWSPVVDPYPVSDEWASYGPTMTLHGEGRRNPSIMTGAWTAVPLDDETTCRAAQYAVIPNTPRVGDPVISQAPAGEPLTFEVVPRLFTIEMSGDCLWKRSP
jgi:hypothetical protein